MTGKLAIQCKSSQTVFFAYKAHSCTHANNLKRSNRGMGTHSSVGKVLACSGFKIQHHINQSWWWTPEDSALGRCGHEDQGSRSCSAPCKIEANLGYPRHVSETATAIPTEMIKWKNLQLHISTSYCRPFKFTHINLHQFSWLASSLHENSITHWDSFHASPQFCPLQHGHGKGIMDLSVMVLVLRSHWFESLTR